MAQWIKVATINQIPKEEAIRVEVGDSQIAIIEHEGAYYAMNNICPHRGGPLHEGPIGDGCISCPWHGWQFDIKTGESPVNPALKQDCYPVKVEGNDLYLEI